MFSVPVFSGRKGFHIYVLFKPITINSSSLNLLIKAVYDYFLSQLTSDERKYIDTTISNRRALIRVPNTLHPLTGRYASPLPSKFTNSSIDFILSWSNKPHDLNELNLTGELKDPRQYTLREPEISIKPVKPEFGLEVNVKISDSIRFLAGLVRPCIVHHASSPEPDHFIRTALSTELAWLDIKPEKQVEVFSKLGWTDFNYKISLYHAKKIYEKVKSKQLFPPSCKTLQERGYCLGKRCPYYPRGVFYWWGVIGEP